MPQPPTHAHALKWAGSLPSALSPSLTAPLAISLALALFLASAPAAAQAQATACKAAPPAAIDIDANSYYSDRNHSVVDPVLKARNVANTRPTNDFLEEIARSASAYLGAPGHGQAEARCAVAWLASWAKQGAMLGKMSSNQSYYQRKWTLGGLALAYAKLKSVATRDEQQQIAAWLGKLADATIAHSEQYKGARNNHYYWEGLAVAATGAVTGEARHLAWGNKVFDAAMAQVAPDGSLPREMERGVKALHYHAFAVAPLVMMASILDRQSTRLDQLVQFTLKSAADPSYIEEKTGFAQERPAGALGWTAIYERHTRSGTAAASVAATASAGSAGSAAATAPAASASPGGAAVPATAARNWQARMGGDLAQANPLEHLAGRPLPAPRP